MNTIMKPDTPQVKKFRQALEMVINLSNASFNKDSSRKVNIKNTEQQYKDAAKAYNVNVEELKVWNHFYDSRGWCTVEHKAYWEVYDKMKANGEFN